MTKNERLTQAQQTAVREWVAAGLRSDEINKLAAAFDPPFELSRGAVSHYRSAMQVDQAAMAKEQKIATLTTGLALQENRVAALQELADKLRVDLIDKDLTWYTETRSVGGGQYIEVERFNAREVDQYRGILDDIAKEVGGRTAQQKVEVSGGLDISVALTAYYSAVEKVYGKH